VEADELGLPEWDWKNFNPGGTVNAKVSDSQLAERMSFYGAVGHPCGSDFRLEPFLKFHPEYEWQREIGGDMPGGPWTQFAISGQKLGREIGVPGVHTNINSLEDAARRRRAGERDTNPPIKPVERPPQ
jgi:hypothetical protein